MKLITFLITAMFIGNIANATENYFIGSGSGNWSDPNNWLNGVPGFNDTVYFDNVTATVNVDLNPNIAALRIVNGSSVVFSSGAVTLITIGNLSVSGKQVLLISANSSLTIKGTLASRGVSIQTYGNFTTTNASIEGNFIFGDFASSWTVNSFPASFCTTNISGTVTVSATNTGSVMVAGISNGNPGTITFLNGAVLNWQRSGGSAPNASYADGSLINVTGIAGSNMNFNSSARFNGLLVWNCTAQSVSGSSAILLPATNSSMDSVRVLSTGSGSLRMATNPNGYTINSLEISGGTVELSAPNTATNNLSDTITNELKITGGTLIGNATFNFDNFGSAYPNTLVLKGNFNMTGGTFNFTNRTAGNSPGGWFALYAGGNVLQTGGSIRASKAFDENYWWMNGSTLQQLSFSNFTDSISLGINNATNVVLGNALVLTKKLQLVRGRLLLQQHQLTINGGNLLQAAVQPIPCIVTNGTGRLLIQRVTGTQLFPVAPFVTGYNGLTLVNNGAANSFAVSVQYGVQPAAILNLNKALNRTWRINTATGVSAGQTTLGFVFSDSEVVAGSTFNPLQAVVPARYLSQWSYDPYQPTVPDLSGGLYAAGPFAPSGTDSLFTLGNIGLINGLYIFTGSGNWNDAANWVNQALPPNPLPAGEEIIVDPSGGDCILNVPQTISQGGRLRIAPDKNLLLPGNLTVQ